MLGSMPSCSTSRAPAPGEHRDLHQLGLIPGRERALTHQAFDGPQELRDDRRRHVQQLTTAAVRLKREADDLLVRQHLRAGELVACVAGWRVGERAHHAIGDV